MNNEKKNYLENLRKTAHTILSMYSPGELEDCLFEVFEEANLYADLTYEEKEKRKLLHQSLRQMFRTADKNQDLTHKILNTCITEI